MLRYNAQNVLTLHLTDSVA